MSQIKLNWISRHQLPLLEALCNLLVKFFYWGVPKKKKEEKKFPNSLKYAFIFFKTHSSLWLV